MLYLENEAAAIYYFADQNLAVTVWKGFANSSELRQMLDAGIEMIQKFPIYYWLSDSRKMKVIRPQDQDYINTQWLQDFIKLSQVKKSATIETEDTFAKISSDNIMRVADKIIPFDTRFFNDFKEAVNWLGVNIKEQDLHGLLKN